MKHRRSSNFQLPRRGRRCALECTRMCRAALRSWAGSTSRRRNLAITLCRLKNVHFLWLLALQKSREFTPHWNYFRMFAIAYRTEVVQIYDSSPTGFTVPVSGTNEQMNEWMREWMHAVFRCVATNFLMMDTVNISETSINFYEITRCNILKSCYLQKNQSKNCKKHEGTHKENLSWKE